MTTDLLLWVLLVLLALNLALCVWLAVRRAPVDAQELVHRERVLDQLQQQGQQTGQRLERVESELRREISEQSRGGRQEMQLTLATFQETLSRQEAEATRTQNAQLDAFAVQLVQLRGTLGDTLTRQLQDMSEGNARRLAEIRTTLDAQLAQLQTQLGTLKVPPVVTRLERLKQQETIQRQMREVLKGAGAQASTGYSDYLMALGRQAQAQLWITGLSIQGDGRQLELRGRTSDPATLPPYLARLNEEERFKGRRFAQLELKAVAEETDAPLGLTDFVLRGQLAAEGPTGRRVREEAQ